MCAVSTPEEPGSAVFRVELSDIGEAYECAGDETLLHAMCRLGRTGIPVGCRGGGCGVCKILVLEGFAEARCMSRAHVTQTDEAQGVVLACRAIPKSDLRIQVLGKMRKAIFSEQGAWHSKSS